MSDIIWKEGDWVRIESQEHFDYVTGLMKKQGLSCNEVCAQYESQEDINLLEVYERSGDLRFLTEHCTTDLQYTDQEVQCPLPSSLDRYSIKVGDEVCVCGEHNTEHNGTVKYVDEDVLVIKNRLKTIPFYLDDVTVSPATAPVLDKLTEWAGSRGMALGIQHILQELVENNIIDEDALDKSLAEKP